MSEWVRLIFFSGTGLSGFSWIKGHFVVVFPSFLELLQFEWIPEIYLNVTNSISWPTSWLVLKKTYLSWAVECRPGTIWLSTFASCICNRLISPLTLLYCSCSRTSSAYWLLLYYHTHTGCAIRFTFHTISVSSTQIKFSFNGIWKCTGIHWQYTKRVPCKTPI